MPFFVPFWIIIFLAPLVLPLTLPWGKWLARCIGLLVLLTAYIWVDVQIAEYILHRRDELDKVRIPFDGLWYLLFGLGLILRLMIVWCLEPWEIYSYGDLRPFGRWVRSREPLQAHFFTKCWWPSCVH
jgi:hypothetical protein